MNFLLDFLIMAAGAALVAHIASCAALQNYFKGSNSVVADLFAIPNEALSTSPTFRLLRARYYVPWVRTGIVASELGVMGRVLLWSARLTGLLVVVTALGFFAFSIVQAVSPT